MKYKMCSSFSVLDCEKCRFSRHNSYDLMTCQTKKNIYLKQACKDCLLQNNCTNVCPSRHKEFLINKE